MKSDHRPGVFLPPNGMICDVTATGTVFGPGPMCQPETAARDERRGVHGKVNRC